MPETILDDTLNYTLPIDQIGNAAYAAEFRLQRTLQVSVAVLAVVAIALSVGLAWTAHRPPAVLVVRVDQVGHADAIRYDALHFTPRESEIRSRLLEWTKYRYRLLKALGDSDFKLNYKYLTLPLADKWMPEDKAELAKILAAEEPEEDVQIDKFSFTRITGATGEARIEITKIIDPDGRAEREPWTITVRYEVDPVAAAERAKEDPEIETVNPLGVFIVWFHEDRAFR